MSLFNYDTLEAQIARNTSRTITLSAASWLYCLTALSELHVLHVWGDDTENDLTTVEWDKVDGYISNAITELLTVETGGADVLGYGIIREQFSAGTHAANSGNTTLQNRALNTIAQDEDIGITLTTYGFEVDTSGLYKLDAYGVGRNCDSHMLLLYDATALTYPLQGDAARSVGQDNTRAEIHDYINLVAEHDYILRHYTESAATYGLGRAVNYSTFTERYAAVVLHLLEVST